MPESTPVAQLPSDGLDLVQELLRRRLTQWGPLDRASDYRSDFGRLPTAIAFGVLEPTEDPHEQPSLQYLAPDGQTLIRQRTLHILHDVTPRPWWDGTDDGEESQEYVDRLVDLLTSERERLSLGSAVAILGQHSPYSDLLLMGQWREARFLGNLGTEWPRQ